MAKKNKKGINLITLILILIAIVLIIVGVVKIINNKNNKVIDESKHNNDEKYVTTLDNGVKLNTSKKVKETKKISNLELKDTQVTYKNGVTNLLATVENKSKNKIEMQEVEIELLDENKDVIYKMKGIIEELEPGESKQFSSSITADFSNVYDFRIIEK